MGRWDKPLGLGALGEGKLKATHGAVERVYSKHLQDAGGARSAAAGRGARLQEMVSLGQCGIKLHAQEKAWVVLKAQEEPPLASVQPLAIGRVGHRKLRTSLVEDEAVKQQRIINQIPTPPYLLEGGQPKHPGLLGNTVPRHR